MPDVAELIAGIAGTVIGGGQGLIGAIGAENANSNLKSLSRQRKPYKTPKEIFDIVNLTAQNASMGYTDETMAYLTGRAGEGLASTVGTAERLGADPNQLSALLGTYYNDIFRVGAESDLVKMKKFDQFTNAINMLAQSKDAEWASADNIIKDQMQAEATKVAAGQKNIQSGLNFGIQSLVNLAGLDMYGEGKPQKQTKPKKTGFA